ncbi:MAG: YhcH/YjgK/YiaL family protein [Bacteroidales bacterium]|nr:YhcH/YjgK/YiaL family protein [Bacteroidales bacterium]MCM1147827.1 YhcH/YjgK/YiaL family protein [Bacteroidales bacterium]MCM1206475.1 YhcH/YjgK/YiaL family protein [Bacillota bacterium]MCM1510360.1 YhcH/YjgK/YiaL family protein [Clostridium sp.]
MKKTILSLLALASLTAAGAQEIYTAQYSDSALVRKAQEWAESGQWKNGFTKAVPDNSVNLTDFYIQYNREPETWKALFAWLEKTDLLAIPAGKHLIEGTDLIVSVEDSKNDDLQKRKTESHRYNCDFMFVVKGTEGFRLLDHKTSTLSTKYTYDVVRYDYDPAKAKTIESVPGRFLIMFPEDWHIAKVKTTKPDQKIRVIVVKMPYRYR